MGVLMAHAKTRRTVAGKTTGEDKVTAVWTTREGDKIPIADLEDSHLLNIIGFLRRTAPPVWEVMGGYMPQGEMAQMAYWQEWDQLEDEPASLHPQWIQLTQEAEDRGLDF